MSTTIRRRDWQIIPIPFDWESKPTSYSMTDGNMCNGKCSPGNRADFTIRFSGYNFIPCTVQYCAKCLAILSDDMKRAIGPEHTITSAL